MFSGVHIHLAVNHAPLFGALFALALVLASFLWAPDVLRRAALVTLVCVAIASIIAYYSGDAAADAIRGFPGVKRDVIHDHEEFAELSFIVSGVVGAIALIVIARWRKTVLPRSAGVWSLAFSAIVFGMMAYTALLGGRVRHTEVRPGATPADAAIVEPRPNAPPP
jgi:glucan phosphoethanolaminetransferase (alkaline phosphatase superfamily)